MRIAKPGSQQPAEHQALLSTATELLKAGQYDQVAQVLAQAQLASEQRGEELPARILEMARQICLACGQTRTEAQWHQQACQEADRRERELKDQLRAILDLMYRDRLPESWEVPSLAATAKLTSPQPEAATSQEPPGLWQRVRNLLGQRSGLHPVRQRALEASPVQKTVPPAAPSRMETERSPSSLAICCLGPFRVYMDNRLITEWHGFKCQAILKYLAAHKGRPVAKDVLMDLFWPDADPEAARRNLHQAVYSLRKTLKQDPSQIQYVSFENDCYLLNPDVEIWLDFEEFETHAQAGQRIDAAGQIPTAMAEYGTAESLYAGDFLEEDLYEDWPSLEREHLRSLYLATATRLSNHYVERAEYAAAITLCQKIVARDPCFEEAHRQIMHCYAALGQRHLAVRQYQAFAEALKQELDLTPSEETEALYQQIMTIA